jgi:hypothetical protein
MARVVRRLGRIDHHPAYRILHLRRGGGVVAMMMIAIIAMMMFMMMVADLGGSRRLGRMAHAGLE